MATTAAEFGHGEGTLKRAAGLVADARTDFNQMSTKLDHQISAVRGKWGGVGADAFFFLNQAWQEKQRTVVGALDEFESALTRTEADDASTDESQSRGYANLAARLH